MCSSLLTERCSNALIPFERRSFFSIFAGCARKLGRSVQLTFIITMLLLLAGPSVFGQQLGQYTFTGAVATCPNLNTSVSTQPANAVFSSYSNTGASCAASNSVFLNTQWNTGSTILLTQYNQFTITPNAGYLLTLTSLSFTQLVSSNNSTTWTLRSSLDNFITDIGTGTATNSSQISVVALPAANFTNIGAVTFRLYLLRVKKSTDSWSNGNVTLSGSVVTIPSIPANPTSNSPQCFNPGVTLIRSGTPPGGEAWYWQTTASGTSLVNSGATYNVTSSGTYYIRSYSSSSGLWSPGAGSATIVITPNVTTPVFTLSASSSRCIGLGTVNYTATASNTTGITYSLDATSLAAGNTINAANGAVNYAAGWSGNTIITAGAAGCAGPLTASHTVTHTTDVGVPSFSLGATSTRCQGAGSITYTATATTNTGITYSLDAASVTGGNSINAATGAVTYSATWTGTSTIAATATGCNGPKSYSHIVTITPTVGMPVFAMGVTSSRCYAAGTVTYTATATNSTSIAYSLDATSSGAGNTIDATTGTVTYTSSWIGTSIITASAQGCNGPKSSTHIITVNGAVTVPVFSIGASTTRCQGGNSVAYAATASNTSGAIGYSLDATTAAFAGNSINAATGFVTYAAGWSGTSTITASAPGCNGPKTANHTVTTAPTVGTPVFNLGPTSTRCQGASVVNYNATATTTTGIIYSLDATSISGGNTINSATGNVTYVATYNGTTIVTANAAGCNGPATANHTVTVTATVGVPVFTSGATSSRCQVAGTVTYTATATTNTGITYSLDATSSAAGNMINSATGAVTYTASWAGNSIITATATGCNGPFTANYTETTNAPVTTPVFSLGATSTICQNPGSVTYTATAGNATGITYSLDGASITGGNTINAATGVVTYAAIWSGTTTITASATGCYGPLTSTHFVTITPTVGTPVFALGATSSHCHVAGTVTYTATATTNTGISYALDAASLGAGNFIDATTGIVTYVDAWVGTSVITATAQGCNGPKSANHTVTVNGSVTVPVFSLGATTTRCQGANNVTYTATASNTSGAISYSLDGASISAGNSINAATGVVIYAATWSGTSTITASAPGCYGAQTSTHIVTITQTVGTPVFVLGASSTRCQGAALITYSASATTTTGITYGLNATSLSGGNTINSATGEVTYSASYSGTTIITASAAGCNGPATANHTVTVTATVGTSVFTLGSSSTRCQKAESVTYSATATANTGLTYSLDGASLAAGNTIDGTTGMVTYLVGWTGTAVITATATGCNGPVSSTHTVTTITYVDIPVFDIGTTSVRCQGSGTVTYPATASNTSGITYSLDGPGVTGGNSINATSGVVTYASTWTGTFTITASAAGCSGPTTATHTVTTTATVGTPVFGLGATTTRCRGAGTVTYTATATTNTGIIYSLDAASLTGGNTIDPATGSVTYAETWDGTTIITASATGCNGPGTANHIVTVTPYVQAPVFGFTASSNRCQGSGSVTYTSTAAYSTSINYSLDAASITAGNSINSSTGIVTYTATYSGTSYITATGSGCGPSVSSIHAAVTPKNVATPVFVKGASSGICQGSIPVTYTASATASTSITYSLDASSLSNGNTINSSTGEVTYSPSWAGTTTVTATAQGCAGPRSASHVVQVIQTVATPVFNLGVSSTRCQGNTTVTYAANAAGQTGMSYILDDASLAGGNTINSSTGAVTFVAAWTGTSIISATATGCSGPANGYHTVSTTPYVTTPVFDVNSISIRCQGAATLPYMATAQYTTGITYSVSGGAGLTINTSTGAVTFSSTYSGTAIVTASAAGCSGPKTATFTITVTPTVGIPVFAMGATSSRCHADGTIKYTATATTNTGITYSLDNASIAGGNSIDVATGIVTYVDSWLGTSVITASAEGCNGPRTASHTVTTNRSVTVPVFSLGSSTVRCQGTGTVIYAASALYTTGITYTLDVTSRNAGNTIAASSGAVTYAAGWSGTSIITAFAAGCYGPQTDIHTVTITPTVGTPVFGMGSTSVRCQGSETVNYSATASTNTGLTYSLDATSLGAGNIINSATGAVTYTNLYNGISTITAVATGCNGPKSGFHTVIINGLVGVPVFDLGDVSARCQASQNVFYRANADNATSIVYSVDNTSAAAGISINASNGKIAYSLLYSGTVYITATAYGCSGPQTAVHTAYTGLVGTPVFAAGSSSVRCIGSNNVTYNASATNTSGLTYSLNSAALSAGNIINAATGEVTYVASWSGSTVITASAAGCTGPRTATHTVTIMPNVTTPLFTLGASSSRCRAAGTVTYTASASNSSGTSYILDAASLAAGNTINTANGAVTYQSSWSGVSFITVTVTGCNGPKTATHAATTNDFVTTPVFNLGSSSIRCQTSETLTYTATAFNSTGITYDIDLNSRNNGNTINQTTGVVVFVPTWFGITTITATATGCSGPKTATHTITTTPIVGTPVFAMGASSVKCQSTEIITYTATATATTGITYSLDSTSLSKGVTIIATTGDVSYPAAYTGVTRISATAAGCSGPKVSVHMATVNAYISTPVFDIGPTSNRCQGGNTVTYNATSAGDAVLSYALDSYSLSLGNLINSSTGAVTFNAGYNGTSVITVTATGCGGPLTASHTVNITPSVGTPIFAMGANSSRCKGAGTFTYPATATNATNITYTIDATSQAAGNTVNAATGAVTFTAAWAGTTTITATSTGCSGTDYSNHIVSTTGNVTTPVFVSGSSSSRCQSAGTVNYKANATYTTGITYTLDNNSLFAGNTINQSTGDVTYSDGWAGTSTITAIATGCSGPTSSSHVVTISPVVPTPVFVMGSSSSRCNGPGNVTYTANASTTITYSLDATSIAAGNTINSLTGTVIYVTGWIGSTQITATAAGCGTPIAMHYATITPNVASPVFNLGSSSTRCQGAGSSTYSATSSNYTGITYSLDAASLTAGNTINTLTGFVTFVADWTNNTTITATATGCNGPASSSHVVSISGNGLPAFAIGNSSTRSQGIETVTYSATANNGNPVTYNLDATSLSAGNTINSATGAVTYTASWSGVSVITASANGCAGTITKGHTASTSPSSVFKQLYLNDPGQTLDRIDPVATLDNTTAVTSTIANGGSVSFTQSPTLCSQLVIKVGRNITITAYTTIVSGTMPANPNITAQLKYGSTNIITLSNPTYNSSTGLLTWVGTLASDVTVPASQAIMLTVASAQSGVSFTITYDSQTKPSKIEIPVSTYIAIQSLGIYDAAYPGGLLVTGGVSGSTKYVRSTVSDPFGFNDINGLSLTMTPPGTTVNATSVATAGCTRTYEYVWITPASSNYININAIAKEGYENTVTSSKSIAYSNCIDCPPLAFNDSAIGAGGAPLIMNVLANDTDPNNNINPLSLKIVTQPQNGTALISNGKVVYLPNGTFSGTDQYTYQICDLTSPSPLCTTAIGLVNIDPTIVDPCGEASLVHTYYIPYPEQDARQALIKSTASAYLPIPSNNIRTIISIKIPYNGMVLRWDHWEDGYEADISNPSQSTTVVWGDGNPYNGIAPGYPSDIIPAGGSIVLDNTMPSFPRIASGIFYDGRDKIVSSGEITMTQVSGEPSIIGVQVMKTNVTATSDFGKSFTIPVGEDFNSQDFKYTALFIRAAENNTEVNIDKDNNGTFETTAILNEGQSLLVDGGVLTGATVTGSALIGVDLHVGGVDGYSSREIPIFPATWYSSVYYTPVPSTRSPDTAVVMLYNNLNRAININWSNGAPSSGTINLPAKTVKRFPLAVSSTNTYKFVNPTGESFTAIEIVDSYTPGFNGSTGNSGSTFDWAFNLIAEERLTTFATIAWAPGSTDGTRNDNPIWVTPSSNTTIYVKYNGSVLSGGSVSPCGFRYDVSYPLSALKYKRVLDNTDKDQSGIAIYTCDGTKIAAVYGEDPSTALDGSPSWDVGTTIKPYCAQKLIFANDDYAYTLTDRAVTIPVLNNDAGFSAEIDPSSLSITGLIKPKHGTVRVNSNGTLLYTPAPGYTGLDTLQYSVCSTPVPVCDLALVIIKINGCPSPGNQNILSGQVFADINKDGVNNDGKTGFPAAKVFFYIDANCNGAIDANELKDSVTVDSLGGYQFITYPQRNIADNFDNPDGTASCASGTDGNTNWLTNWVDAGDVSTGFCVTPAQTYANTDVEMIKDGAFSYAIRLKDQNKSATRTVNISGASAAFLSFSYRKAKSTITAGKDVYVQVSTNGSSFATIFTIPGNGVADTAYVKVSNLDILSYATANTYIRFLTNNSYLDADEIFLDNVDITFLKYPICYITATDPNSIATDYYISTTQKNAYPVTNGGVCLNLFDFGIARKIITVSGNLYNDANGLTDGSVNGTGSSGPAGNTIYAYLVNAATNKILLKTTVNGLTGAYSFNRAEVSTNYTVVLTTTDAVIGAAPPISSNLPLGWVTVGDSYGLNNNAGSGNQTGVPDLAIPVNTNLFDATSINFGINQRPTAGNGSNTAVNPGGTINVTVPASTFTNTLSGSDASPGSISSLLISGFPTYATSITINGIRYTAATFPVAGVSVPATVTGQPTLPILVDPVDGMNKVTIFFYAVDNAGSASLNVGNAVLQMLPDTDKDGIPDITDIDDDNDGIPDVIEVCGNGATSFSCAPGGIDPALDSDGDGIVNWKDADYGPLNARGCTASLDRDVDGVPDFLDLDSDNDGIPDVVEAYGADANGDGVIDNFTDTDGDGLSQNVDANNTGAAGSGNGLGFMDLDGDGVSNAIDLDSDGDGLPDIMEVFGPDTNFDGRIDGFVDLDFDGLADSVDGDTDNDFVIDNPNGPLLKTGIALSNGRASFYPFKNADYIGRANPYDLDSDGDGIADVVESGLSALVGISNGQVSGGKTNGWANSVKLLSSFTLRNTDGRGPADYLDIDSDDDGISDNIEAQSTNGYIVPTDADADSDGIADVYDISMNSYGGNGLTPYDNDGDGLPDHRDLDSDNDGAPDLNEGSRYFNLTQANINSADTDGDGLVDEFDVLNISSLAVNNIFRNLTNSNFGPLGNYNGPLPSGSNVKVVKSDAKMNDRDWRNIVVLPIQITYFNGVYQNDVVTLKWKVENETEVDYYEIERSENGIAFSKIASLKAINRNSYNYNYPDDISSLFSTYVYYRLRQVDKNRQSFVTNVIKWKIEAKRQQPVLYPNPVQNDLKVKFFAIDKQVAEVIVLDAGGRSVLTTRFNMVRGQNILTLPNVGRLNKGMYYLRFKSGPDTWMLKFIVQ